MQLSAHPIIGDQLGNYLETSSFNSFLDILNAGEMTDKTARTGVLIMPYLPVVYLTPIALFTLSDNQKCRIHIGMTANLVIVTENHTFRSSGD